MHVQVYNHRNAGFCFGEYSGCNADWYSSLLRLKFADYHCSEWWRAGWRTGFPDLSFLLSRTWTVADLHGWSGWTSYHCCDAVQILIVYWTEHLAHLNLSGLSQCLPSYSYLNFVSSFRFHGSDLEAAFSCAFPSFLSHFVKFAADCCKNDNWCIKRSETCPRSLICEVYHKLNFKFVLRLWRKAF